MVILDRHKRAMKHKWDDEVPPQVPEEEAQTVKCVKCNFTCPDQGSLDGHMTTVHPGVKRHNCKKCGFSSKRKYILAIHKKGCGGSDKTEKGPEILQLLTDCVSILECGYCSFTSNSDKELAAHVESTHVNVPRENYLKKELNKKAVSEGAKEYKCDLCNFTCGRKEQLLDHVRYECRGEMEVEEEGPVGLVETKVEEFLAEDQSRDVETTQVPPSGDKTQDRSQIEDQDSSKNTRCQQVTDIEAERFQCNLCTTIFLSAPELHQHLFSHTGEKFTCNLCFKRTSSHLELDHHQKYAHNAISTILKPH